MTPTVGQSKHKQRAEVTHPLHLPHARNGNGRELMEPLTPTRPRTGSFAHQEYGSYPGSARVRPYLLRSKVIGDNLRKQLDYMTIGSYFHFFLLMLKLFSFFIYHISVSHVNVCFIIIMNHQIFKMGTDTGKYT